MRFAAITWFLKGSGPLPLLVLLSFGAIPGLVVDLDVREMATFGMLSSLLLSAIA